MLGATRSLELPVRCTWIVNGNGVSLRGELPRRAYWVRMIPTTAQPWTRTGFRHPDLAEYVSDHRGQLLGAVLTLARCWFAEGRPDPKVRPLGSFEGWTRMVGGMLELAGIEGFMANADDLYETGDPEAAERFAFLERLRCELPEKFTAADVAAVLNKGAVTWADSTPGGIAEHIGRPTLARIIGTAFGAKAGRRWDERGLRLVSAGRTRRKVAEWTVTVD